MANSWHMLYKSCIRPSTQRLRHLATSCDMVLTQTTSKPFICSMGCPEKCRASLPIAEAASSVLGEQPSIRASPAISPEAEQDRSKLCLIQGQCFHMLSEFACICKVQFFKETLFKMTSVFSLSTSSSHLLLRSKAPGEILTCVFKAPDSALTFHQSILHDDALPQDFGGAKKPHSLLSSHVGSFLECHRDFAKSTRLSLLANVRSNTQILHCCAASAAISSKSKFKQSLNGYPEYI